MKNNPNFFSVAKVFCNFFGHNYRVSKTVTNHIHEYQCENCGLEMTDTASGFLERLTPKFKETNDYLAQIHKRRRHRILVKAS